MVLRGIVQSGRTDEKRSFVLMQHFLFWEKDYSIDR